MVVWGFCVFFFCFLRFLSAGGAGTSLGAGEGCFLYAHGASPDPKPAALTGGRSAGEWREIIIIIIIIKTSPKTAGVGWVCPPAPLRGGKGGGGRRRGAGGGRGLAAVCARRAGRGVAPAGKGSVAGAGSAPGPEPGPLPVAGMAVPFVEDWDLVQTLGEGAYGE